MAGSSCPAWKATTVKSSHRRRVRPVWWFAAGYLFAGAGLVWYSLASGERVYASTGDSYPGALTAVTEPVGYFTAALAGAVTFGGLLYVAITARPDARNVIDERAFGTHVTIERAATVWALTAIVMVVFQAANDAGAPVTEVIASTGVVEVVLASEMARAWVAVAMMGVVIAVTVRLSVRWMTHVALSVPALIAIVAVPVSGNPGQGPDHDYATSAAIVFTVALAVSVGVKVASALTPPLEAVARRVVITETTSGAVTLGYGAMLLAVLLGPGNPTSHGLRPCRRRNRLCLVDGVGERRPGVDGATAACCCREQAAARAGSCRERRGGGAHRVDGDSAGAAIPDAPVHDVGHLPRIRPARSAERGERF